MRAEAMEAGERIVMVSGAYPPDICGVGDYTGRLMAAAPASWQLFVERDWALAAAPRIVRRLLRLRPSDVVIQYPTQGYGWSLIPHLLAVVGRVTGRYRSVLALHEFSSLSRKSQLMLALTSHFAARLVFTTEVERDRAHMHRFFSSRVPTSVVGILSNIPWFDQPPAFPDRTIDLAYFGHIRPNKGLEDFLEVMATVRGVDAGVRMAIVGEIPAGYEAFAEMVAARCRTIECELILGLDDQAAGQCLADIRILYLPFRDGVSARRGTVLAGLGNGALVATRVGDATPRALQPAVIPCTGTSDDAAVLLAALRWPDSVITKLQHAGRTYLATMLPRDWAHVAALYERAITGGPLATERTPC